MQPNTVERFLWRKGFSQFLPEIPYTSLNSRMGKLQLCSYLERYGLGVIRGVDIETGMVAKVGNQIGNVRVTNYGSIFDVQDKGAEATNLAFTSQRIRAHTDNPYRDPFPGVQMLHCLESAEEGGATMFIDGFRVAEELRIQDPEAFRMLAATSHPFEYRDPDEGVLLRATAPVIQLDQANDVQRITFNNRSAAALPASFPNLEEYYRAWAAFDFLANSDDYAVKLLMRPGDLAIWLNGRVMHGRESYCAGGRRHIQGAYLDQDEIHSSVMAALAEGVDISSFDVHKLAANICMEVLSSLRRTAEEDPFREALKLATAARRSGAGSDIILACLMHAASRPHTLEIWTQVAQANFRQLLDLGETISPLARMGFSAEVVAFAQKVEDGWRFDGLSREEQQKFLAIPEAEMLLQCIRACRDGMAPSMPDSFHGLLHEHFQQQSK